MTTECTNAPKLPLPRWCFVVLAVPTFFMPLAYLLLLVWVVVEIVMIGGLPEPQPWLADILAQSMVVTFAILPIYLLWAALSKRLSLREKLEWLVLIVLGNMITMPVFFVFIIRRYLGLDRRPNPRTEAAVDALLARCKVRRESFSEGQLDVLRRHCRTRRVERWCIVPWLLTVALMLYMAIVFIPHSCEHIFIDNDFIPTRMIVIDKANDSRKEYAPKPEHQKGYVQVIFLFGAMSGQMGMTALFFFMMGCFWPLRNRDLIAFVKAAESPTTTPPPSENTSR